MNIFKFTLLFIVLFIASSCKSGNIDVMVKLSQEYKWYGINVQHLKDNTYEYEAIIKKDNDESYCHGTLEYKNNSITILTQEK